MAAGNQPTFNYINATAGSLTVSLRNDMQNIINFNAYLTSVGGASFLESTLNMTADDSSALVATFGNLAQLAGIYQGQGTQAAVFNYEANSNVLWGGQ